MSSPDRARGRLAMVAGLLCLGLAASGCTVRPLYSDASLVGPATGDAAKLASIGIKPVETRYAQIVRNELIFLLDRGSGEPANPAYELKLAVASTVTPTIFAPLPNQTNDDVGVSTAAAVTLTAAYTLTDLKTSSVIAGGKRRASASFDQPLQQYAALTAEQDAQKRAAKELAQQLQLALAQDLAR